LAELGSSMLGPGGTGLTNVAQAPSKFLIGSVVISLSRCCLPNNEGPGPQIFFPDLHLIFWKDFLLSWKLSNKWVNPRELVTRTFWRCLTCLQECKKREGICHAKTKDNISVSISQVLLHWIFWKALGMQLTETCEILEKTTVIDSWSAQHQQLKWSPGKFNTQTSGSYKHWLKCPALKSFWDNTECIFL